MKNLFLILLCASLFQVGCGEEAHVKEGETLGKLLVTSPIVLDTSIIKSYVCQIRSTQHIELRALEKGYIKNIYVDEGQHVKKGQLMFLINPAIYKAELQKAEAEKNYANIELQNTKSLSDKNIVSKNELALANAKYEKAQAEKELAMVHLGFTEVRAPFDGIMDHFQVRQGSLVDEGDLLTTLSDNSNVWVYFNVPEAEYLDYKTKVNQDSPLNVRLLLANNELFAYPGVVKTIEADFNNETGNIAFRATFPNPKGLLRHGQTGNIQVVIPLKKALIIPQKATFEVLDKKYVYVVDSKNIIKSRMVVVSHEMQHLYAISGGLEVGDKILLEGLGKVKENQKINPEYKEPANVLQHLDLYAE